MEEQIGERGEKDQKMMVGWIDGQTGGWVDG